MNELIFPNRLVLSAMAGINDAEFCSQQPAGLLILGGFNVDNISLSAALKTVKKGRKEFLFEEYDNPLKGIENEVRLISKYIEQRYTKKLYKQQENQEENQNPPKFAVNIRSGTTEGYIAAAEIASRYGGMIEINAHCRQADFIDAKCGQYLAFHEEKLFEIVNEVSNATQLPVLVKIRGGLRGLNYTDIAKQLGDMGVTIHLDAMIEGSGCDLELISKLSKHATIIGNNSVVDVQSAEKVIDAGALMVSAARGVLKDKMFFEKLLKSKSKILNSYVSFPYNITSFKKRNRNKSNPDKK